MHRETRQHTRARNTATVGGLNAPTETGDVDITPAVDPNIEESKSDKCRRVARLLREINLSFGEFSVAVCYGDDSLRNNNNCISARNSLYHTECLEQLLINSHRPPRPPSRGGPRPTAGTQAIDSFAQQVTCERFAKELEDFSEGFTIADKDLADTSKLKQYSSKLLHQRIQTKCPSLFTMLCNLTGTKHPEEGIVIQVASLAYRQNKHHNALQKYLSIYMQAQHLSKSAFFLLQQAGIVMSYSWTRKAIKVLDEDMRVLVEKIAKLGPLLIVHDNIRLEEPAASQRGDNQSVTDNGTAITVIHLPPSALALENCGAFKEFMHALNNSQMQGTAPKLSWQDLDQPQLLMYNRASNIHDILDLFQMIPELSSIDWNADKLKRPIGPKQLPHGPEHCVEQHMVPVVQINESSYSGNSQVVPYAIKKIGLHPIPEQIRLAMNRLFLWVGDQLTAQRCRQLQLMAHASVNAMERMEPFRFIFGGFHMLMALGWSILENFRGSNIGPTFANDIILLSRRNLEKAQAGKRGKDFHAYDEFLLHEIEAHMRGLFMHLTGCDTSEKLTAWALGHGAADLHQVASNVLRNHTSSQALVMDQSGDELHHLIIMRQRELLLYFSLRRAFKHGDVDRIEALLPELLFYFTGAGNNNYAQEILEFLQFITHECTPEIRAVVWQHGFMVNCLGRADSFLPIDQLQEHNNAAIRVCMHHNYMSMILSIY
ncbi:hypothetical protein RSOL_142830 [Rhizoctonia solani AG-3 Rhs1AP]|uniref:DUF6589 domain-containing protein n=2 Tax=Rhizoctonia solani AG-3 TaxID=1086053 RepID=A0A074RR20_9AGAM|nr:hypothetical protein RSOL_142830 [Rhizoctonia solani AG-3 Rhs1AP]KEP47740.1 hypothetical protein V565_145580 [Rhizoctonia solani 123E]